MEKFKALKDVLKRALKPLGDKNGWKKDVKKVAIILAVLLGAVIVLTTFSFVSSKIPFGLKTDLFVEKVHYQKYAHMGPDFSFRYPDYFVLDENQNKKYGADYLIGVRLKTDQRTGCDIRFAQNGINFKKSDEEIKNVLNKELSKNTKNFQLLNFGRRKIAGENSFQMQFSFVDPTGATVRLSQDITSHKGQAYLIICGTGDYQYKFFQKDFDGFTNSLKWNK